MLYLAELLQTLWRNKIGYWRTGKGVWRRCARVPALGRESDVSASGYFVHAGNTDTHRCLYMDSCQAVCWMVQGYLHVCCLDKHGWTVLQVSFVLRYMYNVRVKPFCRSMRVLGDNTSYTIEKGLLHGPYMQTCAHV